MKLDGSFVKVVKLSLFYLVVNILISCLFIAPKSASAISLEPIILGNYIPEKTDKKEIRGVWLWGSVVAEQGAEAIVEQLSRHGINKVFFLVKGHSGIVSYQSKLAPMMNPERDYLREIIDACHARDIEVHAWFVHHGDVHWGQLNLEETLYHIGNPEQWDKGPYLRGLHLLAGKYSQIRICPQSTKYQEYFLSLINEVMEGYNVDGIHLDYIRYPHIAYCFCPRHLASAKKYGINIDRIREVAYKTFFADDKDANYYFNQYRAGDKDIVAWVNLRQKEIYNNVKDIHEFVEGKNPAIPFSAALNPEGAELDDTFALTHYAQNYATIGPLFDFITPMTYHKEYGKDMQWVVDITKNAMRKTNRPVYAGIQAYGDITATEVRDTIKLLRKNGLNDFVLFRYGTWREMFYFPLLYKKQLKCR